MKKRLLFSIVTLFVLIALVLTACNTKEDDTGKDPSTGGEVECPHDWIKTNTVNGNCSTYGYSEFECSVCGEKKREYDEQYAAHVYANHVCLHCGGRQNGDKMWKSGDTSVYLYSLTLTISGGDKTYILLVDGKGKTADYTASSLPWGEYLNQIVRFEAVGSVTAIGNSFLHGAAKLSDVKISAPVKKIGADAFAECSSLDTVSLGDSLEEVGEGAFTNCRALKRIAFPNTATTFAPRIFGGCRSLQALTIGVTHATAGNERFFGSLFGEGDGKQKFTLDSKEYSYRVPESLAELNLTCDGEIEDYVFYGCSDIQRLKITGDITSIGRYAFAKMSNLVKLELTKESLLTVGEFAFADDGRLGSNSIDYDTGETLYNPIILPASVVSIGRNAFDSCRGMVTVVISGNNVTEIPVECFAYCTGLRSITMPECVQIIQSGAFRNTGLQEVKIVSAVVSVGLDAFRDCTSLKTVYVDSANVYAGCADGNSGLFSKITVSVWVKKDIVGSVADAKKPGSCFIKQEMAYKNYNAETEYYLWEK